MGQSNINNKRIAKNTIYLYIRMIAITLVALYTSRVVLAALGASDYGVYNVVGGFISMLTYINMLIAGGSSRFITIGIGKNDIHKLNKIFSTSHALVIIAALVIFLIGNTIGLWFINSYLNISPSRMYAANWVYQCSLLACCLSVIQSVYTSEIIAHENMNVYAYMSIIDVTLKLIIAFSVDLFSKDKLILYAILMLLSQIIDFIIYRFYCVKRYQEVNNIIKIDKPLFKEMFAYNSWTMIIGLGSILSNSGISVLLNIFFGTVVNAARGLAGQVTNKVQELYSNFQVASRPQIMKYYAQGNIEDMSNLIINSAKYCFYILLCIGIPLFITVNELLNIWLVSVPAYTATFIQISIIGIFLWAIDGPIGIGIQATGRMKMPALTTSLVWISVFPAVWIAMKLGANPSQAYLLTIYPNLFNTWIDLILLHNYTTFSIKRFIAKALWPIIYITILSIIACLIIHQLLSLKGFLCLIECLIMAFVTAVIIFFIGTSKRIRAKFISKLRHRL